jgi:hypothetical protein
MLKRLAIHFGHYGTNLEEKSSQRTREIHQNPHIVYHIGPRDLEFHPIWLYDMPKCSVDTDGHILAIMGPIWEKKFAKDIPNPSK